MVKSDIRMSLADELLADLEEIDNDDLAEQLESIKEEPIEAENVEITEVDIMPMEIDVSVGFLFPFFFEFFCLQ